MFHISDFISLIEGTNFDYIIVEKNMIKYTNIKGANIETCKLIIDELEKKRTKTYTFKSYPIYKKKICLHSSALEWYVVFSI